MTEPPSREDVEEALLQQPHSTELLALLDALLYGESK